MEGQLPKFKGQDYERERNTRLFDRVLGIRGTLKAKDKALAARMRGTRDSDSPSLTKSPMTGNRDSPSLTKTSKRTLPVYMR